MALNVISNYAANVAHRYLQQSDEAATRSVAKLAAGTRVLGARDDAASLAIATSIRSDLGGLKQASVNAGQAASMLQIADGAMGTVTDILVRAKTLAVQAASDQLTNTQREMVAVEFTALQDEVDRISASTRFDGQTLLAGASMGGKSSKVAASVSDNNRQNQYATISYEFNASGDLTTMAGANGASVLASIGGTNLKLDLATSVDTADELAAAINADAVFKQYFVASSEKINNNAETSRLYLTALTSNALTSFSVVDKGDLTNAATGLTSSSEKVGEAIVYDFSQTKLTSNDKLSFNLGGATYDINLSDLKSWASEVSNVASATGTADNKVAAQAKKVEYDLTGFLSKASDQLSVTINGTAYTDTAASGESVADVLDSFVTANASTIASAKGVTVTREGNKLVLQGTAGTDFTVGSVSAQNAGATAQEISGTVLQTNKTQAAVGIDSDGNFVRKNTTTVQSSNTTTQLTTKEALDFLAAYVNDSSSAPHALGAAVIASVTADNELVLTARGGTRGQQAEFSEGTFFATTSSQAFEVTFQIGAKNASHERLTVSIANVSTESLGVDKDTVKITTAQNALNAIDSLNSALDSMARNRADIGAQQNRLDFASANIAATIENQEAARSNLMDLDVAAEMSYFTGQQILQQAGVSMLAQANQMPQNLMRLFR